jgi:hypothetical protein
MDELQKRTPAPPLLADLRQKPRIIRTHNHNHAFFFELHEPGVESVHQLLEKGIYARFHVTTMTFVTYGR